MTIRDENGFQLVDYDYTTGRSVWSYYDGEKIVYRTDYPVQSLIDVNAEQRNIARRGWSGDYHQIASIPLNTFFDSGMARAVGEGDDKFVSRWLNDSDNRAWRTKGGAV